MLNSNFPRVIVELINDVVDEAELTAAVENAFSVPSNGSNIIVAPSISLSDGDALEVTARRLLFEIIEDEKRQSQPEKRDRRSSQKRSIQSERKATPNPDVPKFKAPDAIVLEDSQNGACSVRPGGRVRKGNVGSSGQHRSSVRQPLKSPKPPKPKKAKKNNKDTRDMADRARGAALETKMNTWISEPASASTPVLSGEKKTNPGGTVGAAPSFEEKRSSIIDQTRLEIRKAFRDIFTLRAKEADDVLLTNEEIKLVAVDLEQNVFKYHCKDGNSNSSAYKEQCDNLSSNLRNPTNKGLFRRLLNGELQCKRAAVLTVHQMASSEFSFWASAERSVGNLANGTSGQETMCAGRPKSRDSEKTGDVLELLNSDTTANHKSHLFDVNCKICTGRLQEDNAGPSTVKKEREYHPPLRSSTVKAKQDYGEKLFKREDGNLDVMIPVPSRQKDPLQQNSTSPQGNISDASPLSVDFSYRSNKGNSCYDRRRSSADCEPPPPRRSLTSDSLAYTERCRSVCSSYSRYQSRSRHPPTSTTSEIIPFWHGWLHMIPRFQFEADFVPVSGPVHLLYGCFPSAIEIIGRIQPHLVYDYLQKIRKRSEKDLIVFSVREPVNAQDLRQWYEFYENMLRRQHISVVDIKNLPAIKDFYVIPLPASELPDRSLLPFIGPGLELPRRKTILGVVVRHRDQSVSSTLPYSTFSDAGSRVPMTSGNTQSSVPQLGYDDPSSAFEASTIAGDATMNTPSTSNVDSLLYEISGVNFN